MTNLQKFSLDNLKYDKDGLIPAVAQDWLDGSILMLAWMNMESLKRTLETKEAHYWSRSRSELWRKGATSGNTQTIKGIRFDCDKDSIILTIKQNGNGACHTGERSCFFNEIINYSAPQIKKNVKPPSEKCSELSQILIERSISPKDESYTNYLLAKGSNTILKKIGEETAEFIMACKDKDKESIASEAGDLIYHLQVALLHRGVEWKDVLSVLEGRRK